MTGGPTATDDEYRHELRRLAADVDRDFESKLSEALALGCAYFDVELGYLTRVADKIQEPLVVEGDNHIIRDGAAWPLSVSYCQCVLEEGGPFEATSADERIPRAATETFEIETYFGAPISVGHEVYGTICFADTEPRTEPFSRKERAFLEELAAWIGRELTFRAVQRDLETEREELKQSIRTIGHDLRNSLSTVYANLELLDEEYEDDRLTMALGGLEQTEELLADVLEYVHDRDAEYEPVSLASIAREVWESVAPETATLQVDTERVVRARPNRLRQLFENVFENAVRHAGADVIVRVEPDDHSIRICDDGPGFPGSRTDRTTAGYSPDDGTGFGHPIVEHIAEAHGWTVRFENDDGACVVVDDVTFQETTDQHGSERAQ